MSSPDADVTYRVTSHLLDFEEAILSPCSHFSMLSIPFPVIALASTTVMFCDTSFFSCANCSISSASFLIWRYDASILDSTRRTWKDRMFCSILVTTMDLLALLWWLVLISSPGHALLTLMITHTRRHQKIGVCLKRLRKNTQQTLSIHKPTFWVSHYLIKHQSVMWRLQHSGMCNVLPGRSVQLAEDTVACGRVGVQNYQQLPSSYCWWYILLMVQMTQQIRMSHSDDSRNTSACCIVMTTKTHQNIARWWQARTHLHIS